MRALKPGSNRRFQAVPNPNEIAARTTMGNCIGINRNDPETLDTGSANVTRPVTGKCHRRRRRSGVARIPRPDGGFLFSCWPCLGSRALLLASQTLQAERTKKNLIFISLFGLLCGGCYQRGVGGKKVHRTLNAVALWLVRVINRGDL